MNCKQVKNNLIFYYYGDLQEEQAKEIEQHLETCQSCAKEYTKISKILSYAQAEKELEPNPFIFTRIKAKLESEKHHNSIIPAVYKLLQPALATFVVALGIILGVVLGNAYAKNELIAQADPIITQQLEENPFISLGELDMQYLIVND